MTDKERELVMQAIGEASMCWNPIPKGVFDSTNAKRVGEELLAKLESMEVGDDK